jgi:hypothetical protein
MSSTQRQLTNFSGAGASRQFMLEHLAQEFARLNFELSNGVG